MVQERHKRKRVDHDADMPVKGKVNIGGYGLDIIDCARASTEAGPSKRILQRAGHRAVLSTDFAAQSRQDDDDSKDSVRTGPRFELLRLANVIDGEHLVSLRECVESLWAAGVPSHAVVTGGNSFRQWCFGVWSSYITHHTLRRETREAVQALLRAYDQAFGRKPSRILDKLAKTTSGRMQRAHIRLHKYLRRLSERESGTKSFRSTAQAICVSEPTSLRMGGMGTMLSVTWGDELGTAWHRCSKDHRGHYTIISVVGSAAQLDIEELGLTVPPQDGDIIAIVAAKYTCRLRLVPSPDPPAAESAPPLENVAGSGGPSRAAQPAGRLGKRPFVLTCWTGAATEEADLRDRLAYNAARADAAEGIADPVSAEAEDAPVVAVESAALPGPGVLTPKLEQDSA